MKLLVIGLDGMTFDVIDPLVEMGHLPHLARLMRDGAHSPVLSTRPSITPVAWSSFITGKPPGDHGVYDWGIKTSDYRISIINANYLQDQSIWTILHRAGKKIGVIGLPMTYPPSPYPSFMIGGPLSPSVHSAFTYPEGLYQEIREHVGEYIIDFDKKQQLAEGEESFVAAMARMVKVRAETTLYLMQQYPWDVLMPVFVAPDRLQHCLWQHLDFSRPLTRIQQQIIGFYDFLDEVIGRIVAAVPEPKTVLVVSDHGFGPGERKVSLNGWLMREGYLVRGSPDLKKGARRQAVALANRLGLTREQLQKWASRLGVSELLADRLAQVSTYNLAFDWQRSVAFAGGPGIYLNVKGREREGIVATGAEYERVRQEIAQKLARLRDPRGDRAVFEQVSYREEFYTGRRVDMAPDIIPSPNEGYGPSPQFYEEDSRAIREDVFEDPRAWDQGMHRREGVLIAWGEAIVSGARLQQLPYIWDVAPTLLNLADVPVPADMTGQPIAGLLQHEPQPRTGVVSQESRGAAPESEGSLWASEDDERLVEERLRGLGYLE